MTRTAVPIAATSAIVRGALVHAPNLRNANIEIELTVKASDVVADLTPAEARAIDADRTAVVFSVALTNDDGSVLTGLAPAYHEAAFYRVALTADQAGALRNLIAGRPADVDA